MGNEANKRVVIGYLLTVVPAGGIAGMAAVATGMPPGGYLAAVTNLLISEPGRLPA